MAGDFNSLGQLLGPVVANWRIPAAPSREPMIGRYCRLEALNPARHAEALHAANALGPEGRMWTYLTYGPFASKAEFVTWLENAAQSTDPLYYAVIDLKTSQPVGTTAYLRIDPPNGVIEIGSLAFSPLLQRTPAATETIYLMLDRVFSLGYRRCEWKCHSLNTPSRAAAQRFGFTFEGIFRHAMVTKGRNRDTAWYSIIDSEWPALRELYTRWLAPANFDAAGKQRESFSTLVTSQRRTRS